MMTITFSCDMYDLDINEDPNNPTEASLDLLLPAIQFSWAKNHNFAHSVSSGTRGQPGNRDGLDFDQNTFNNVWYCQILELLLYCC